MSTVSRPNSAPLSLSPVGGRWVNQMGSEMVIAVGPEGRLEGEFSAAVGSQADRSYPLVGMCQLRTSGPVAPLAFVVDWTEARCVTAWCGEYVSGPFEEIRATWLMTCETAPGDEWRATVTGHDIFHRV